MDEDKSIDVGELVRKLESANLALKSIGRCMGLTNELWLVDSGDYKGFSTVANDTVVDINVMPYDYEWPRFSGVETVKIGNGFTDRNGIGRTVESIRFYDSDFSICADDGTLHYYNYGEPVAPAPVLAADGKPLEVGQTVYGIEDGAEYKVCDFDEGGPIVEYWDGGIFVNGCASPLQLTHQRPDTWERIEREIERGKTYSDECVLSIVRRCRALAGVSK